MPVSRVCRSRVTITVVASPPCSGIRRGSTRLEERPERVAQPAPVRSTVAHLPFRAGSAGRGEGLQVGQQPVGHGVGDPAAEVGGAVTPPARRQPRVAGRSRLLALQRPPLLLVGDLGGDHVEHPAPQDPQLPRTEPCGLGHQPLLGQALDVGADVVGQVVQRPHDHLGLRGVDDAFPQPRGHPLPPGVQRLAQAQVPPALTAVQPRRVAQPRRLVAGTDLLGHVGGRGEDPQSQLRQPSRQLGQLQQRLPLVAGAHEARVDVGDVLQRRVDRRRAAQYGMGVVELGP